MVTGMVKNTKIGFKTAFKKANTTAKIKAVKKLLPSMLTPGNSQAVIKTAMVDKINFTIKFISV